MFFVYILRSEKNCRYYIGCTKNLAQRLDQHNAGMTKATRNLRPWRLVHTEGYENFAQARQQEAQIKAWKNPEYIKRTLGLPD